MLHYLIVTNTRAPDLRAGSNVVVGGEQLEDLEYMHFLTDRQGMSLRARRPTPPWATSPPACPSPPTGMAQCLQFCPSEA